VTTPVAPPRPQDPGLDPGEFSLLGGLTVLLEQRRLIAMVTGVLVVAVVVVTLAWPRSYTAETAFMPQTGESSRNPAAGLAARFGVTIPAADPGQSPQFYGRLAKSEEVLRGLIDSGYTAAPGEPPRTLIELYGVEGETDEERRIEAVRRLRDHMRVTLDPETGVVEVGISSRWPTVSYELAQRLLALLNDFNLTRRQSRAGAERRFVEARLQEAAAELRASEDELQTFLQRNRQYRDSPQLQFVYDRLQRTVNMRQTVYTSLVDRHEEARIEEVRDTPVLTVVEPPRVPEFPDRRRLLFKAVLALLIGLVLAAGVAAWRQAVTAAREADPERADRLARALEGLRRDARSWWPVRRRG